MRTPVQWLAAGGVLLAAAVVAVIWLRRDSPEPAPHGPREVRVFFTGDVSGMLTPCNCFTGQLGGLTRLWSLYQSLPSPNALKVDVGDAVRSPQDFNVIEYRHILDVYGEMGYAAANLGRREAALDRITLRALAAGSPCPLLSANLLDAGTREPIVAPHRVVRVNGARIGILGVVDEALVRDQLGAGLAVEPMDVALARRIPELAGKTDCLMLLAFTDESGLARLAEKFYELDVILGGAVSQPAPELKRVNQSLISYITNQSRALGMLDVQIDRPGQVSDHAHEIILVADFIPQAPAVLEHVRDFREEVRHTVLDIDQPEQNAGNRVPGVARVAEYAGTPACLDCHPQAAQVWKQSGHAHAWETLVAAGSDFDPNCIGCHTVGFGTESGYRRAFDGAKLADVGCESCHGPGSLHVEQWRRGGPVTFKFRPLGAGDCQQCHYGKFSRPFDFDTWWPPIQHGEEPAAANPVPSEI